MFDVLGELSFHAEKIGYDTLAEALVLCMDVFENDERRLGHQSVGLPGNLPKPYTVRKIKTYTIASKHKIQTGPVSTLLVDHVAKERAAHPQAEVISFESPRAIEERALSPQTAKPRLQSDRIG